MGLDSDEYPFLRFKNSVLSEGERHMWFNKVKKKRRKTYGGEDGKGKTDGFVTMCM